MVARHRALARRLLTALMLVLTLDLVVACTVEVETEPATCAEQTPLAVVDEPVRAFLVSAKRAHDLADKAVEAGDREAAIAVLATLSNAPLPVSPAVDAPAREAMADALARLAELRGEAGQHDDAVADVDRGLTIAASSSYVRGRLLEVRGGVEHARAKQLSEDGDEAAAAQARLRAASAFEQARLVQRAVVKRALACATATKAVDVGLIAYLSLVAASHRLADLSNNTGERIALLDDLLSEPAPGGMAPSAASPPEVREVMADTLARLAELRSTQAQSDKAGFEQAKKDIKRGLELAVERTHYRGRLMEVLGLVEERQREALLEADDEQGAEDAKARAIAAFQEAIAIQDEVIQNALEPTP